MIARTWHGLTPLETKTAFRKYLEQTGVRDALALPGNRGAFVSVVDQGAYAHFFLCTFWESREDVLAYAGDNPSLAVTYPEDAAFGLISDPIVIHQEVPEARNPFVEGEPRQNLLESASGQRENPPLEAVAETLRAVRQTSPLVHFITNYVTVNDVANILLACGASPIMADDRNDVEDITAICGGLNINIGTLNQNTVPSMLLAGKKANELGHQVLLDPVGAGAGTFRTETALNLMREVRFDVIRGNISEIKTLARGFGRTKGVDADAADAVTEDNLSGAVTFVREMAAGLGCIIAVTGAIDLVSDGNSTYVIRNGRPEMGQITGTGCQLSGLMTAYLTANPDNRLEAAAAAVCAMGLAGEIGWSHLESYEGNATYRNRIIDAIYRLDGDTLEKGARYEIRQ